MINKDFIDKINEIIPMAVGAKIKIKSNNCNKLFESLKECKKHNNCNFILQKMENMNCIKKNY